MAKKNFKSGLGSLIQDTRLNSEPDNEPKAVETPEANGEPVGDADLLIRIHQLERELELWRTGKLNQTKFGDSLKKNKLEYNKRTNLIEGI